MAFISFAYNSISASVHHSFVIVHSTLCFCLESASNYITFKWFHGFKMCLKMLFIITARFEHFITELAWPKVPLLGMTIFHMRTKIIILQIVLFMHLHTWMTKMMSEIEDSQEQDIYTHVYDSFGVILNIVHCRKTFCILNIHVFYSQIDD